MTFKKQTKKGDELSQTNHCSLILWGYAEVHLGLSERVL